ncbi:DASH complex, subunit Spc19 [Polychaeton citri CBS 116435]|uniref:DASH complex subunit SPC19 n=1 Tax=Polychaeton citri CBS 116435 TaxID=1314669 RepID=A0A9P4QGY7_9PEZI|nr:DASH complex, subunit Spc19 [Polychaeton citri CBS 116435]
MDSSSQSALQGCVASLKSSMQLLDSSINILDSGVHDYPRLSKVLQTTRHFELVSEHDLTTAQSSLLAEIQPEVTSLLSRVETYLDKLERREQSLIAKADLQAGRLAQPTRGGDGRFSGGSGAVQRKASSGGSGGRDAGSKGLDELEKMKMQQLKQKKDRLSFAVSRLELQAGQRQRQLRKSMAA